MDKPGGHHAERHVYAGHKTGTTVSFHFCEIPVIVKLTASRRGKKKWGGTARGCGGSVWDDEEVSGMDGAGGGTTT